MVVLSGFYMYSVKSTRYSITSITIAVRFLSKHHEINVLLNDQRMRGLRR